MIFEQTIVVHGKVQGVGYRNSILRFIENEYLSLKGYVQNLPNGTVRIVSQGSREELEKMRKFSSLGSDISIVDHIEEIIHEKGAYTFDSFDIEY